MRLLAKLCETESLNKYAERFGKPKIIMAQQWDLILRLVEEKYTKLGGLRLQTTMSTSRTTGATIVKRMPFCPSKN